MGLLRGFIIRLRVARKVLFGNHWFLVSISDSELDNMLLGEDFETEMEFKGLHKYLINNYVYLMSKDIDENSLLLNRMEFEVEAEEFSKSKGK